MLNADYSNQAKKFLKQSDKIIVKRILDEIEKLCMNPFPKDVKRVEGYAEKVFRVRIGDYRILYEVDHDSSLLGIVKIDKRGRVYE